MFNESTGLVTFEVLLQTLFQFSVFRTLRKGGKHTYALTALQWDPEKLSPPTCRFKLTCFQKSLAPQSPPFQTQGLTCEGFTVCAGSVDILQAPWESKHGQPLGSDHGLPANRKLRTPRAVTRGNPFTQILSEQTQTRRVCPAHGLLVCSKRFLSYLLLKRHFVESLVESVQITHAVRMRKAVALPLSCCV